jgi:hypothetical protein
MLSQLKIVYVFILRFKKGGRRLLEGSKYTEQVFATYAIK